MTIQREQGQVFGEVADLYDDVRPGYPLQIAELIVGYAGRVPAQIAESGAGTGKGTALLRTLGVPVTCVEPDPAMAALLARRFHADGLVSVAVSRFEDWTPPDGGVELLASAQAWHWVDHERRGELAHDALALGGVIALFGHHYGFVDDGLDDELTAVYARHAPQLTESVDRKQQFHPDELRMSPLFRDFDEQQVTTVLPLATSRYLVLLSTFSGHRMLPEDQRARLLDAIAQLVDRRGGVVEVKLTTGLCLARKRAA